MIERPKAYRYAQLIESMLAGISVAGDPIETGDDALMERGLIFPLSVIRRVTQAQITSFIQRSAIIASQPTRAVDTAGQSRPVYLPLLVYAWGRTLGTYPALTHDNGAPLAALRWSRIMAGNDVLLRSDSPEDVWRALALQALAPLIPASKITLQSGDVFRQLAHAQQPNGSFIAPDTKAHPEITWYRELQLLHAAGSYFAMTGDVEVREAIGRCADYCLAEIQPDHATTQPWAVYPLLLQSHSQSLAEEILHGYRIAHPAGPDALGALLLADAVVGLRARSP